MTQRIRSVFSLLLIASLAALLYSGGPAGCDSTTTESPGTTGGTSGGSTGGTTAGTTGGTTAGTGGGPECGNDVVEEGEVCDGNCPTSCPQVDCNLFTLTGTDCTRECVSDGPQTACADDDNCCPGVCNETNDNNCDPVCDNGVLETGETCDPVSQCQTQSDACVGDADNIRTPSGVVGECTFVCTVTPRPCQSGDTFCPSTCNTDNDADCCGADPDGDGVGDNVGALCDNCPGVANPGQDNSDNDSFGDACDNCPIIDNEDQLNRHGLAAIPVAFTPVPPCDADGGGCSAVTFSNGLSAPISLDDTGQTFNFVFFGKTYTHIRVSENGFIYLGTSADPNDFAGVSAGDPQGGELGFFDGFDDLAAGVWTGISSPTVTFDQLGSAANNSFIINFSGTSYQSQIQLLESANRITVRTTTLGAGGTVDTRGVEGLFLGNSNCNNNGVCSIGETCLTCATDCCGAAAGEELSTAYFGYVGSLYLDENPVGTDENAADFGATNTQVEYTTAAAPDVIGDACDNFQVTPACGDNVCNAICNINVFGDCETTANCGDCANGDNICDLSEHVNSGGVEFCDFLGSSPNDCTPCCGDGICDPFSNSEDSSFCSDCFCGDGICESAEDRTATGGSPDFICGTCPGDCGLPCCGDGFCDPSNNEDSGFCSSDCFCGDGICDVFEDSFSCPADCF